ncbi:MAG: universal stress protein [Chloroflexota bacterium]
MITKIVVPLDGSPQAEQILPYVTQIGGQTGATISLMTSIAPVMFWEPSAAINEKKEEGCAIDYLERQRLSLEKSGIDASIQVDRGRPASQIVKFAAEQGADLIAMTTHGRSGIARLSLGSIATGVLHQSHLPLLLVHPADEEKGDSSSIRRVYLPDDGSDLAASVRPFIADFAKAMASSVILHRVVESLAPATLPSVQEAIAMATDEIAKDAASFERAGVETRVMVTKGRVPDELLRAASELDGGLIAMSTHGYSGARRLLLGSVAHAMVRRTELPCLLVRPPEIRRQIESAN